jgi:hypothetical protein
MKKELPKISDLSPHLFWDCDQSEVTWENDSLLLVERILQYGIMKDWEILKSAYSLKEIANCAQQLKSIDPVSLSFISLISGIPKSKFRCYTEKQLNPTLWNS